MGDTVEAIVLFLALTALYLVGGWTAIIIGVVAYLVLCVLYGVARGLIDVWFYHRRKDV